MSDQKKNVIITCADARAGDFLADHWLRSLVKNVDLSETDIVILDYGLTEAMKERIRARSAAHIVPCVKNGHLVVLRFRDMGALLKGASYEQVLSCDGGDIIFQSDISAVFREHPGEFRAVSEGYLTPFQDTLTRRTQRVVDAALDGRIFRALYGQPAINGGFILAPRASMIELCDFIHAHVTDQGAFGPDQILIGYFFYLHGFHSLDPRYNFILYTSQDSFRIVGGRFLDSQSRIIPVVHNAGRFAWFRVIDDFGFGPDRNRLKKGLYYLVRAAILILHATGRRFFLARLTARVEE